MRRRDALVARARCTGDETTGYWGVVPPRAHSRALVVGAVSIVSVMSGQRKALAQEAPSPCALVREHRRDTVVLFQPPSTFTICRGGLVEDDVVTGRPVYFELTPTPGSRMFDFRIHGKATDWTPAGLASWQQQALQISAHVHELERSNEPISGLTMPTETPSSAASPLRPVAAARTRYLGVVTQRYLDLLHDLRAEAPELPIVATVVRQWCSELGVNAPASAAAGAELQTRCAGPELGSGALEQGVTALDAAAKRFELSRVRARDAVVAAIAQPEDANAVAAAAHALDDARAGAEAALAAAGALRESSAALARDVATVRMAIHSLDAVRPGVATYLSTYSNAGNAALEIDATAFDSAASSDPTTLRTTGTAIARFPVVGRHYIDFEAGLGVTGGLPLLPSVGTRANTAVIEGRPVDEFVGLALVELEPARFLWPDRPLSGLFRFPVIGVPFTRDPTQNFFVGAGLGWTGIGSITVGPYMLRELTLRDGYAVGEALPVGTSFDAATNAALQVGYFASASIDLVGLFHVFFPGHPTAIDGATGKEE